jgi:hypothetical protein
VASAHEPQSSQRHEAKEHTLATAGVACGVTYALMEREMVSELRVRRGSGGKEAQATDIKGDTSKGLSEMRNRMCKPVHVLPLRAAQAGFRWWRVPVVSWMRRNFFVFNDLGAGI